MTRIKGLILIAFHLGLLPLYLWSANHSAYHVALEVAEREVTASVNGQICCRTNRKEFPSGPLVVLVNRPYGFNQWIVRSSLPQSLRHIKVLNLPGNEVLYDVRSAHVLPRFSDLLMGKHLYDPTQVPSSASTLLRIGDKSWTAYRVDAELARGRDVAVRVVITEPGSFIELKVRPFFHTDVSLATVKNHKVVKTSVGKFQCDAITELAWVLEKFIVIYSCGLILGLLIAALSVAGLIGLSRAQRFVSRASASDVGLKTYYRIMGLLVIVSILSSGSIMTIVGHAIPHVQDSVVSLFQAKILASGRLWAPLPTFPDFFAHQYMVMKQGKMFAMYPYGHTLLLAGGVLIGCPWLIPPLIGGLCLVLCIKLGTVLYDRETALAAGALTVASPFFLLMNGTFMSHPAGLLYTLIAVYLTAADVKSAPLWRGGGAGLAVTLLGATRPLNAPVTMLVMGLLLLEKWRSRRERLRRFIVGIALGLALGGGLFLGYNALLTGEPLRTTYSYYAEKDMVGSQVGFNDRLTIGRALSNLNSLTSNFMAFLLKWPAFLTLAPLLFGLVWLRKTTADWVLLSGLASIVAAYFFYIKPSICYGPRYYYEAFPYLILLMVRGIRAPLDSVEAAAVQRWKLEPARTSRTMTVLRRFVYCGLIAASIGNPRSYHAVIREMRGYNNLSRGILDEVSTLGLTNALVFVEPLNRAPSWVAYGSVFTANDPWFDSEVVYAHLLGPYTDRLLMDVYPERSYYRANYVRGSVVPYPPALIPNVPRWGPPETEGECNTHLAWITEQPLATDPEGGWITIVATASFGLKPGRFNLYVNGEYAVTLDCTALNLEPEKPAYRWADHDYRVRFIPKGLIPASNSEPEMLSGLLFIDVPAERWIPHHPCYLRVSAVVDSLGGGYFYLHGFTNTLEYLSQYHQELLNPESQSLVEGFRELIYPPDEPVVYRQSYRGLHYRPAHNGRIDGCSMKNLSVRKRPRKALP